jgi:ornithine cyclodeaminase/alanine dehydrogenase-like protein (mu-crystallin family)
VTLVLSTEDAAQVLDIGAVITCLEETYADLGAGSAIYRGRTDLFHPTSAAIGADIPAAHQFKTLDGAIPRHQVASIRVTSDVVAFPLVDGARRRIKIPAAENKSWVGLVFLFSSATGELVSILQDGILQKFAVGAINAIGAKYLARQNAKTIGLIGAGNQAGPQIAALAQVRAIDSVRVFSPKRDETEAFCARLGNELGIACFVAATAEEAVRGCDIAVTATNSRAPFFKAEWLEKGMHLSCMQRDEPTDECFSKADISVFHTRMKEHEYVSTDFAEMERRHDFIMRDHPESQIDWNAFPDLGELVSGRAARRTRDDEITLFLNSTGVGTQFTAVGHLVYERAKAAGLGTQIPTALFNQPMPP